MAKIRTGAIIAEIRNKLGDVVYSRNKYGAFARLRVDPENAATPARATARDRLAAADLSWNNDLNDAQRRAWHHYANTLSRRAGPINGRPRTGHTAFLSAYLNLDNIDVAPLTDPPDQALIGGVQNLTLTVDADTQTFQLDGDVPADTPDQGLVILATPPLTPARYFCFPFARQIAALAPGWSFPLELWDEYTEILDTPGDGWAVTVYVHAIAALSGLAAPRQAVRALATGSGGPMLYKATVLSNAQIKALPTTPVTIVPAVAGRIIVPFFITIDVQSPDGVYTNVTAGMGAYLQAKNSYAITNRLPNDYMLGYADRMFGQLTPFNDLDAIAPTITQTYSNSDTVDNMLGNPLTLACVNGGGNFTGGGAGNSMTVTVFYQLVTPE